MILADTPIWLDHLRDGDEVLRGLLEENRVLMHPLVRGEIALLASHAGRGTLVALGQLPAAAAVTHDEVLHMIDAEQLYGCGIGYAAAQLLASARMTPGAALWTREGRLAAVAERMGCAARVV